jgi:uncharacterized protein YkwD
MKRVLALSIFYGIFHNPAFANAGAQPEINAVELERQIHQQINRERQNHGLLPFLMDEQLALIARNHSHDMARHQFFNHLNLRGEGPTERGKNHGWNRKKQIGPDTWLISLGENLFLNHLYDQAVSTIQNGITIKKEYTWKTQKKIALETVQGLMKSPHHRKNILSPLYDRQGIGVAISGNDVYVTEDLF